MKDYEENVMITMTETIQFVEHFGLSYGSFHIICKIKPGRYNLTKVAVITNDQYLQHDIVHRRKSFPGLRKLTFTVARARSWHFQRALGPDLFADSDLDPERSHEPCIIRKTSNFQAESL